MSTERTLGKCMVDRKRLVDSPCNDKQDTANTQVGQENVDPDVRGHGVQEGEEAIFSGVGFAIQDADAHAHVGLGEVDDLFTHVGDGEGRYCQVSSL